MNEVGSKHVAIRSSETFLKAGDEQTTKYTVDNDDINDSHKCGAKVARKARKKKVRSRKSKRTTHLTPTAASSQQKQEQSHNKLFVGQLPSDFDEEHLRVIFKPFGKISHLKVCREEETGKSERCCFVTFDEPSSALAARTALHNIVFLPGMLKPLQVKFADYVSNLRRRKLFIGMISKQVNEDELIAMFAIFGEIEECAIIRDLDRQSKGCAFITYAHKDAAKEAIDNLHLSRVMRGCSSPIVVKLADSKAVKAIKRLEKSFPFTAIATPRFASDSAEYFKPCRLRTPAPAMVNLTNSHSNSAVFDNAVMSDCAMIGFPRSSTSIQQHSGGSTCVAYPLSSPSGFFAVPSLDFTASDLMMSLAGPAYHHHLQQCQSAQS